MPEIRIHNIAELEPALLAELAAGGYRAVRDPDLVIYIADRAPVTLPSGPLAPPDATEAASPPAPPEPQV